LAQGFVSQSSLPRERRAKSKGEEAVEPDAAADVGLDGSWAGEYSTSFFSKFAFTSRNSKKKSTFATFSTSGAEKMILQYHN
jgi:hypothetical protein